MIDLGKFDHASNGGNYGYVKVIDDSTADGSGNKVVAFQSSNAGQTTPFINTSVDATKPLVISGRVYLGFNDWPNFMLAVRDRQGQAFIGGDNVLSLFHLSMKNNISTQDTYPGQPKNIYDSLKWKEKQWIRFDTYLYLHPTDMTQCSVKTILTGGITDADGNPVGNGVIETKTIDLSSTNYLTKGKLDVSFIGNPAAWSAKQNELYLDDVKIYQQHADAQALTLDKTADVDPAGAEIGAKLVFTQRR